MRIRRDLLFVSSVLLTIALLSLVPSQWMNASGGHEVHPDNWAATSLSKEIHDFAIANLATISIVLIVIWTGYVKGLRSAWFIMFVFVWVWAFPLMILPYLRALQYNAFNPAVWFPEAVKQSGFARSLAEMMAAFSLMVIGLFLPLKALFFGRRGPNLPT